MDIRNRMLLQQHQQLIVSDLDVIYILDELFSKQAISHEDFDHILQLHDRADRVRFLLKTLLQNGNNNSYEAFIDSLAKDYNWIWKKFALADTKTMIEDSFEDSISRGDVPRLPDHYVRRNAIEEDVANKLESLTRHKILVLHGMSGCGKTCVAISVLRHNPKLVTDNFNGVVFWRNLANCKTEDDIIAQQNKLYRKASLLCSNNSLFMNSSISMTSIGSTADSISSTDWTSQELKGRLKTLFSDEALKKSLLVLDEVNEKECLEALDIGCKILVTTRDTDVIANFHPQIVKVENHFTEEESLALFASCIDVPVSKLPRQAKKLHEICKGSPFHISLIGAELAENKERLVHDTRQWNYYLSKLEKKEYFFLTKQNGNPMKTIEMCINSLKPDILPLFKMLAILPDNAKVSAKVLSKLWNKDVRKVESIMKQLRSKSLIIEFFDQEQRNYIYEVHDLIMNYLKTTVTDNEARKLHRDFLKSYSYDEDNAPVEIEDDGYIAFYIGYHLLWTQNLSNMWSLFGKLFLDLKFLGNKVRLTGPADVILDLQKYENYIVDGELDRELLRSVMQYLNTHGTELYRWTSTDVVQSVLQHEARGVLYARALDLAERRCARNELYFDFLHEQNVEEIKHSTIDVKEIITTVCFMRNYVVAGTVTGSIKFFQISTNKMKKELKCGDTSIKWVGVSPVNPQRVASLTYDGVIRLFYVDDLEDEESDDVIEEENEEPFNNNEASNTTIHPRLGAFVSCRWANTDELIVTHTAKEIIIYKTNGKVHLFIDNLYRNNEMLCCVLCNFDKHAIVASTGSVNSLDVIDLKTKTRHSFEDTDLILDVLVVSDSKIITLKQKEISEFECKMSTYIRQTCTSCQGRSVLRAESVKPNLTFISVAANKSGTLLFVSTDDSRVLCVDLKTSTHIFDLENRRGNVVTMAMSEFLMDDFEPGSDVLLTGTGTIENSLKVWFLDPSYVSLNTHKNAKVRLTTKFDASFITTVTPHTPTHTQPPNSTPQSTHTTPQRHQSFANAKEVKKQLKCTMSLDRHMLKPLNLKGICNTSDGAAQPLLAVVDDKNNIQVMRGRKLLTEISTDSEELVTAVKISPCNQHVVYGLHSGIVRKYSFRTKESKDIMDVYSAVKYMSFVNPDLLIVAGENRCIMADRLMENGEWRSEMLQRGNCNLGSQELLNNLQGVKKKYQNDDISNSSSELSVNSRLISDNRVFKPSNLVDCYWLKDAGLVTVESNATIKLWDEHLKLSSVLNGKQMDVNIKCCAFEKNVLVICDDHNLTFQTFKLNKRENVSLSVIQEGRLNNRIICCALTEDGNILAMGLDSGDIVIWNVPKKRQLRLLKHHKSKVQWCGFSPSPAPRAAPPPAPDEPPLVLVSAAGEIVWWDITYLIRMKASRGWNNWNVVTPLASPLEPKTGPISSDCNSNSHFFFGDNYLDPHYHWKQHWKGKTFKEGSKRKEILSCIKLFGMYAKSIQHDEKFCRFVTVDNTGHVHIMSLMDSNTS